MALFVGLFIFEGVKVERLTNLFKNQGTKFYFWSEWGFFLNKLYLRPLPSMCECQNEGMNEFFTTSFMNPFMQNSHIQPLFLL